ncbi:MAG TPA: NAD-dependent epimerase/dehydratase family protein [bacterium]|nr:NAD-dependent epimerase/dehydratase family protein [bacterium]
MTQNLEQSIRLLPGPILVLGASGFVGANLMRKLMAVREDVYGTSSRTAPWRLEGLPEQRIVAADLLVERNLVTLIDRIRPRTVFDCVAYGAYSFEKENGLIFRTNVDYVVRLVQELVKVGVSCYIHAGSSSEYGDAAAGPKEESHLKPDSAYAASKAAASQYLYYMGKKHGFPCANLRLYSVYGPWEDASRFIPAIVMNGMKGAYPPLVDPSVSRDFVFVDDVTEAFILSALELKPEHYGDSYNIGSGIKTTVGDLALMAKGLFKLNAEPSFGTMPKRHWDHADWYADPSKARRVLGWRARTSLDEGLAKTAEWMRGLRDLDVYRGASKQFGKDTVYSVSAVVACANAPEPLEDLYRRLKAVLERLNIQHEIILVNDGAGEAVERCIQELSAQDRDVLGLTHSRPFGTQAAFRSGMQASTKNACVLISGDGQEPPELIEAFVTQWKAGFEVVYGRPSQLGQPFLARAAYGLFYRVFDRFSYIRMPHDAGDFGLMDRRVVQSLLRFPERDLFIRGVRAFAGFKQIGVDYERSQPRGLLARLFKNLGRAKRGLLGFSTAPLSMLSAAGMALFLMSVLLGLFQLLLKVFEPASTPRGVATTLLVITFFGSLNLLGISVLGEYLATIFEEVKQRPHSILSHVVRDGEVRSSSSNVDTVLGNPGGGA